MNNRKPAAGPLMCWDIFMESHHRRLMQAEGLSLLQRFAQQQRWRMDWDLNRFLMAEECVALVTDTAQIIRFATPNIPAMNGYEVQEVLGKTPRMFQGKDTEPEVRALIREAIGKRLPFKGTILNYRKDHTPYHCLVEEYPVWDTKGALVNFVAFEKIA